MKSLPRTDLTDSDSWKVWGDEDDHTDPVKHPEHYTAGGMEVIDVLRAKLPPEQLEGHLRACVLKYLFRYDRKGDPYADLRKAATYLAWLREFWETGTITVIKEGT